MPDAGDTESRKGQAPLPPAHTELPPAMRAVLAASQALAKVA